MNEMFGFFVTFEGDEKPTFVGVVSAESYGRALLLAVEAWGTSSSYKHVSLFCSSSSFWQGAGLPIAFHPNQIGTIR